jgi:type II secretory pathway component GspD/PulD (secretin)
MTHNKLLQIFLVISVSVLFGQQIERILPYSNGDTTGIHIIYNGELNYEKKILHSPPNLSLIFPNYTLKEGNQVKIIDFPPLYRLSAQETINTQYYKHVRIDLNFNEVPEYRIDHIGENIIRVIWPTIYTKEVKSDDIVDDDEDIGEIEIWSNFENEVSVNLRYAKLIDVLRLLAMQNGMNIITNDQIDGTVTLTLHEVSVGSALDAILKVNGYDWFIQENLIIIKPIEDDIMGGLVTRLYKLEHTDAFSVGNAISNILTDKGKFQVFSPVSSSSFFNTSQYNAAGATQGSQMGSMNRGGMAGGNQMMGGMAGGNQMMGGMAGGNQMMGGMGNQQGMMGGMMQNPESMMTADHILVTDIYSNFENIESIIEKLDVRVPQINISVKFVETKLNVDERLGIDWAVRAESFGPVPDTEAEVIDFEDFKLFDTDNLSLFAFNLPVFENIIEMLESDGETRLMQEPQLTTKNNTVATFKVGTTYPTLVTQTTQIAQTVTYEEREINIILNVQPRVNENEFVSMDISTTVQALVGFTGINNDQPIISNRASTTHVRVEDQKTLMIGGLIFDQAVENINKVPILSSIPILGNLFKHTNYSTEQRELLIFITPSIIKNQ